MAHKAPPARRAWPVSWGQLVRPGLPVRLVRPVSWALQGQSVLLGLKARRVRRGSPAPLGLLVPLVPLALPVPLAFLALPESRAWSVLQDPRALLAWLGLLGPRASRVWLGLPVPPDRRDPPDLRV